MQGLRITFLLPGSGHLPTGGGKVVYEYANHLSRRGHRVTLVHPALVTRHASPFQIMRSACAYVHRLQSNGFHPRSWFPLEAPVRLMWVPTLSARFVPDSDVVLATAWSTAEWAVDYPSAKGQKFYLIQSWETWAGPEDRVRATWLMPYKKIVIACWLRDIAMELGVECSYIPNGIDFEQFGLDTPIESRNPKQMMMLYHTHPVKGSVDGLEALSLVRKKLPDLRVTLFGTGPAPALPAWIKYHRLPSQRLLRACYNQASIFIALRSGHRRHGHRGSPRIRRSRTDRAVEPGARSRKAGRERAAPDAFTGTQNQNCTPGAAMYSEIQLGGGCGFFRASIEPKPPSPVRNESGIAGSDRWHPRRRLSPDNYDERNYLRLHGSLLAASAGE
jgi:hypothetical protein